jgi:signal transduction histidine kinase
MINKSIFLRLLISYVLTVLLGLCVVGFSMAYITKDYIMDSKQEDMVRKAKKVNLAIQEFNEMNDNARSMLIFLDQSFDSRIWVFDTQGKIVATSSKDELSIGKSVDKSIVKKVENGENTEVNLNFDDMMEPMVSVVVPWGKEDHVYGGIILYSPVTDINDAIQSIRETILWVTLIGIVLSSTVAFYMSWTISHPIQMIDRAASKIGMGDYSGRIDTRFKDEIGDLAGTINQMAEKLEQSDNEKRKLEQLRLDFLANASHELRTPLTAMQGFLEALQDGLIDDGGRQKYYEIIYKETIHMNRLVDDIMDLTRLENKEITLSRHPVDVKSLLQKVLFKFTQEAEDHGTKIELRILEPLPLVFVDPDRLEQILNNLVKNAVKFTENGLITIAADEDGAFIRLTVTDTGIGISKTDQELIWERLFKVDRGYSNKQKGTGLGLAIVKQLVELHEGRISVNSEVGEGTTFTAWIPKAII